MDKEHLRLKKEIVEIIRKNIKARHYRVFFFGSRVNGQATEKSDIDIGIEAAEKISVGEKLEVKEKLEEIRTLNKLDFVDFADVDEDFKEVAQQSIEVIYEK